MKFQKIGRVTATAGLVLLALTGVQTANATDWNFGSLTNNTIYTSGAGLSLTGMSTSNTSTAVSTSYNSAGSSSFTAANVYSWGSNGLGIVKPTYESSSATGPHAFDNVSGTDAVVLGFGGTKVNLSSLKIGWNGYDNCTADSTTGCSTNVTTGKGTEVTNAYKGYNDSDLSVFAWMGTGTPTTTPTMAALTGATAVTNGWKLIGNYGDVGTLGSNTQALASSVYSSNWLISAYNSNYGTATSGTVGGFNDAFKLLAVSGGACSLVLSGNACGPAQVPEPSGLALLGLGLVGLLSTQKARRRRIVAI